MVAQSEFWLVAYLVCWWDKKTAAQLAVRLAHLMAALLVPLKVVHWECLKVVKKEQQTVVQRASPKESQLAAYWDSAWVWSWVD